MRKLNNSDRIENRKYFRYLLRSEYSILISISENFGKFEPPSTLEQLAKTSVGRRAPQLL